MSTFAESVDVRLRKAASFWTEGDEALAARKLDRAYRLYTQAHDLVTDCPRLHLEAHRRLGRVTRTHKDKREFVTDWLLVKLAPLGVFELIAKFMHSGRNRADACRRGA